MSTINIPVRLALILFITTSLQQANAKPKPSFRSNLKQFGYVEARDVWEYSSLGFLSDDLLLVTINQQRFSHKIAPLSANLLVFQLSTKKVISSAVMMVARSSRSVVPLSSGDFLVASILDVKLCSPDLRCKKIVVGGLIDLKHLKGLGDLVLRPEDVSSDGKRCISSELSSTIWNKISHPISIDEPSPDDYRRITVFDKASKKPLISLHYNPKNQIVGAAISPGGTKLAVVRRGTLEVYDLPK